MLQNVLKVFIISFILVLFVGSDQALAQTSILNQVRGRILLQVEANGEAWYVHPETGRRHYLGRPDDAFAIMREQSVGISNADLAKIPIGLNEMYGADNDGDGLPNTFEQAVGTNVNLSDTDEDGYSDYTEIKNDFSPLLEQAKLNYDLNFSKKLLGKIFLQVESNGEAWYVHPPDGRRYYLGRPDDAFAIMRKLGLGITNVNLETILKPGDILADDNFIFDEGEEDDLIGFDDIDEFTDNVLGDLYSSEVAAINYIDLECPFCKNNYQTMKELFIEYNGKLVWVVRNFALESLHPAAGVKAEAAECVASLGDVDDYLVFVEEVFELPQGKDFFIEDVYPALENLEIDVDDFTECMDNDEYLQKVNDDYQQAIDDGGRGTPYTVFVNKQGDVRKVDGALPIDQLRTEIEALLE